MNYFQPFIHWSISQRSFVQGELACTLCSRWFRVWDRNTGTKLFWGFRDYLKMGSKQHPTDFLCLQQQEKKTAVQIKTSFKSRKLNLRSLSLYSVRCFLCAGYILTPHCQFNNSQMTQIFTSGLLPYWIIINLEVVFTEPEKCNLAQADLFYCLKSLCSQ